jgi:hypothetical protein
LSKILDFPILVFLISFITLWLSTRTGALIAHLHPLKESEKEYVGHMSNTSLTLLALIIGFAFSMAVSRYDLRKADEEDEANAIGTEYARAGLLPPADAAKVRNLLVQYVDQRLRFYTARELQPLDDINARTAKLQGQMWSAVQDVARSQPNPAIALALSGMNDVLNTQGYTQAAWWNRIPPGGWCLMIGIAVCSGLLTGYSTDIKKGLLSGILPLLVSIAFFFIADIDSPRRGVIHVAPKNLTSLSHSLHG